MNDLEVIYVRHSRARMDTHMPPSTIYFYDLTAVVSGVLEYTINGKNITLNSGDVIFIPPESVRQRKAADKPCDYISFNFTCDEAIDLPLYIPHGLTNELVVEIALCDELVKKLYPNYGEVLSPLITCMLKTLKSNLESENLPETVRKIIDYIHKNLSGKITLKDIGEYTFFSPIYCDTLFKSAIGRSIIDYVIELRIEEAKKLILNDAASLSDIAASAGFSDYNYFARTFKKRCGYTPLEYKKIFLKSHER